MTQAIATPQSLTFNMDRDTFSVAMIIAYILLDYTHRITITWEGATVGLVNRHRSILINSSDLVMLATSLEDHPRYTKGHRDSKEGHTDPD